MRTQPCAADAPSRTLPQGYSCPGAAAAELALLGAAEASADADQPGGDEAVSPGSFSLTASACQSTLGASLASALSTGPGQLDFGSPTHPRWAFVDGGHLGAGGFGEVFAITHESGQQMAMKVIPVEDPSREALDELGREISIMRMLSHENIIKLYGQMFDAENLFIFMELATGGTLTRLIRAQGGFLPYGQLQHCGAQMFSGLRYLHSQRIVHRDVKSENVLISDGVLKLADFGISKELGTLGSRGARTQKGTPPFMAPEVARGDAPKRSQQSPGRRGPPRRPSPSTPPSPLNPGYGSKADVWSGGCTMLEMMGRQPWPSMHPMMLIYKIINLEGPPPGMPDSCHSTLQEVLSRCFVVDPAERSTAAAVLDMDFFRVPSDELDRWLPVPDPRVATAAAPQGPRADSLVADMLR